MVSRLLTLYNPLISMDKNINMSPSTIELSLRLKAEGRGPRADEYTCEDYGKSHLDTSYVRIQIFPS
jgi:hypothetical protein